MSDEKIIELIKRKGSITVSELCDAENISESTARRIIAALAEQGKVERYRGGARFINEYEPSVKLRADLLKEEKWAIAEAACGLIEKPEPIMLVNSSTVNCMADFLSLESGHNIVTNSISVLDKIVDSDNTVIMIGGVLNKDEMCLDGPLNRACLNELRISKLFFSISGVDTEFGLSDVDMNQTALFQSLFESSFKRIMLVDHTKFSQTGLYVIAPLNQVDVIITDSKADPETIQRLEDKGISVIVVDVIN